MNPLRYFFTLFVVLFSYSPLSAQTIDEDDRFYLNFSGSAVFPYEPESQSGAIFPVGAPWNSVKAGAGFTAAFGYAFKEGFSTEMEWGYQKIGVGNSLEETSSHNFGCLDLPGFEDLLLCSPPITITTTTELDGEIKTQSLMGNVYYRYPKWRVSPYAGFGLGAFFYDGAYTFTFSSTTERESLPPSPGRIYLTSFPSFTSSEPIRISGAYENSRFAYQVMGGLSARVSKRVEFRFGYRFRSSRGEPIDADQIEAGIRFRF